MAPLNFGRRRLRQRWGITGIVVVLAGVLMLVVGSALATHGATSLTNSNFEIDSDANLVVNHASPSIDWLNAAGNPLAMRDGVIAKPDKATGSGDDSFGEGSKEDTAAPTAVSGAIPPNKSDLKNFGMYVEEGGTAGFLHLFWTRVQDPKGTTNMDFEFNKNKCEYLGGATTPTSDSLCSTNGVTPQRSSGDLLITYDLSRGGTVPTLSLREWDGTAWGSETNLTDSNKAIGSINTSKILAADSGGLGSLDPRTFGEASIDLTAVFDAGTCESFGSAYLKSRSSDSFPAALKDFIAPQAATISNCGTVIIRKVTIPGSTESFSFTSNISTQPATTNATFEVAASTDTPPVGRTIVNVLAGSYNVTEVGETGYALTGIDCAVAGRVSSVPVANRTVTLASSKVGFTIAAGQVLDCTFTNTKQKSNPSAASTPTLVPQDKATISGLDATGAVDGTADKTMTFSLHKTTGTSCDSTNRVYSKQVTVTANGEYKTENSGDGTAGYSITEPGTYKWLVVYNGDSRNNGFTIACGLENVVVTAVVSHTP